MLTEVPRPKKVQKILPMQKDLEIISPTTLNTAAALSPYMRRLLTFSASALIFRIRGKNTGLCKIINDLKNPMAILWVAESMNPLEISCCIKYSVSPKKSQT